MTMQQVHSKMIVDPYNQPEIATPTTFPPAGSRRLYPKADGLYYQIDSAGVEVPISAGGGGVLPLTQPLTFSPDATHAIGPAGFRPSTIDASGRVTADSFLSIGNMVYLGDTTNYMHQAGGAFYMRPATGTLYVQNTDGSVMGTVSCGSVSASGGITAGAAISAGTSITSGTELRANNGYLYLGTGGDHVIASAGQFYLRPSSGYTNIQDGVAGWGHLFSGNTIINGYLQLGSVGISSTAGDLNIRRPSDGQAYIFFSDPGHYLHFNGSTQYLFQSADVRAGWGFFCGGNYTAQGQGNNGHVFMGPNIANPTGQGWANAWVDASSRDFKEAITPFADPLSVVLDDTLHGVRYLHVGPDKSIGQIQMAADQGRIEEAQIVQTPQIGFVADDWLPIVPEVVTLDPEGKVNGLMYGRIGAITFEGLKQLAQLVQTLEARVATLEATP